MHPGIRAVDGVDVAAVVHIDIIRLDRHFAVLIRALTDAALVGFIGDVFWAMSPINNYPSSSMLEALASGLPVVATDTGMTRELIVHRQNGLLVSPQNPREVANATEEILTGNRFRKALSINARATAEKYDIRVVLPRIAQLYHSLAMKETMI